ncbi:MAG: aryl-sulfate sulfotransferase [Bacteroidota bacterium]
MNLRILLLLFLPILSVAQQYPGKTSYSVKNTTSSYLIDTNGTVTHTWTHASNAPTCYSTYVMPGGVLWRTVSKAGNSFSGGPISGQFQKIDYNGTVLWDFVYSTTSYCSHHDICPMPNGNVLLIAYEARSQAEVTAAGCTGYTGIMWPDKVVEVQQTGLTTGVVVWEWKAWDHLVQNVNPSLANYQSSIVNHPELLHINYRPQKDWMHANGVHYNPILDQIAISSHNLNEIYVIDHSTTMAEAAGHTGGNAGKGGDILYRWGNPAAYSAAGTANFNVVHDAHWIQEGCPNAGELAGYNNRGISATASCADIFLPPVNGYNYTINLGSAYGPVTYSIRQACGGYNGNEGSSQQLPNGNILVNMGTSGMVKEFDPAGNLLWSKSLGGGNAKAFRYSDCYLDNQPPPIPTISESNGVLTASSAASYQWYLNGQSLSGETAQSLSAIQNGVYVVRTTDVNGCVYRYSPGFNYQLSTGVPEADAAGPYVISPNPSDGSVRITDRSVFESRFTVHVMDALGQVLLKSRNIYELDLSEYGSGLYLVSITPDRGKTILQKVIVH